MLVEYTCYVKMLVCKALGMEKQFICQCLEGQSLIF